MTKPPPSQSSHAGIPRRSSRVGALPSLPSLRNSIPRLGNEGERGQSPRREHHPRWHLLDETRRARLELLVGALPELPPDDRIAARAIELRRQKKMNLADSILAATALLHRLPLVTRNEANLDRITESLWEEHGTAQARAPSGRRLALGI